MYFLYGKMGSMAMTGEITKLGTKKGEKENLVKTAFGEMYPSFIDFCKTNTIVHQKHLLPFFIIQVINARHILRKWNNAFKINKHYIAARLKNATNLLFQDYTLRGGELVLVVVKIWENYCMGDFIKKYKMIEEVYEKILKFLENKDIGTRLFTREVEIVDWYNNICEFFSLNVCSTLVSITTQSGLYPCSIKLMMKYNKGLSFYDVNRFITVILRHKILHKSAINIISVCNTKNTEITTKIFYRRYNKIVKTCRDLIINSNVGYASICREMMQSCVLAINNCIDLIDNLQGYKKKFPHLLERTDYIRNTHREMSVNVILANTYLILILIIAYQEPEHIKGLNTIVSLSREYGTYCTNGLKKFCELFASYLEYSSISDKTRIIHEERSIAVSVRMTLRILRIYFGIYPENKPVMPKYLDGIVINRGTILRVLRAKVKANNITNEKVQL